jgi:hypothetical protein
VVYLVGFGSGRILCDSLAVVSLPRDGLLATAALVLAAAVFHRRRAAHGAGAAV